MSGRTQFDGDQIRDESITGDDVKDDSLTKEDIQDFTFANLDDTDINSPETSQVPTYNEVTSKWENKDNFGEAAIFPITLTHNGGVSNNTFYGYQNTINGLDSPIPVQRKSILKVLTFTNNRFNADYIIELRKNSSTATPFLTITKTNTQTFVFDKDDDVAIEESFQKGDIIFVKHVNNGQNPRDVGITLNFAAVA